MKGEATLRSLIRLVIESSPSRLKIRVKDFDPDSDPNRPSHLDQIPFQPIEQEEETLAPHLAWAEQENLKDPEEEDRGPVPPNPEKVHIFPDPYVRGQYDNVTWQR